MMSRVIGKNKETMINVGVRVVFDVIEPESGSTLLLFVSHLYVVPYLWLMTSCGIIRTPRFKSFYSEYLESGHNHELLACK